MWTTGATTQSVTDLCVGNHAVTITDPIGCFIIDTFTIECEPPLLVADMVEVEDASCFGEDSGSISVTLSGGMDPFVFCLINNLGDTISINSNVDGTITYSNLLAGDYTVKVTDNSPCEEQTIEIPATVEQPEQLVVTVDEVTPAACPLANGSIDVTVSGGAPIYQYYWEFGANTMDPTGVAAGTYDLTIVDAMGCLEIFTDLVEVECFQIPNINLDDPLCINNADGIIEIDEPQTGTAPFTYIVEDTNGELITSSATNTITGLAAGTYVVYVQDSEENETSPQTVTLEAQSLLEGSYSIQTDFNGFANPCFDSEEASVDLSADLGVGTYEFFTCESLPLANTTINNLGSGEQCFYVVDSLGCIDTITALITSPEQITVVDQILEEELCFGEANGAIELVVEGGVEGYSYLWDDASAQTTPIAVNIGPGLYTVEITDENDCEQYYTITLGGPEEITGSLVVVDSGDDVCSGALAVEVEGGTAPYTYEWSNGDNQFVSNELCPGDYAVTVTDANGCPITLSDEVRNENDACLSFRNVISPNGDGYNEFFYIHCLEDFTENTLEIYNRWGYLVYSTTNYNNTWNGKDQGAGVDLPEGGYFFVLKYREQGATELSQMKGHVTIIRE